MGMDNTITTPLATLRQIGITIGLHENTLYVLRRRAHMKGEYFPHPHVTTRQLDLYDPNEIALWYAERHPTEGTPE
jgi:hypothetical protein